MRRPLILAVAAVEYTARALLAPQMAALQDRGYDMRLACAPDGEAFGADLQRFTPLDLRFPRSVRPRAIARALSDLRRMVHELRPDVVHLHTPAAALPARLIPRSMFPVDTKIVYTVHGFAHTWDDPSLRSLVLERAERVLARRADALLFQSQEDLEEVRRRGYRTRTIYLGNGVQDQWFTGPVADPPAVRNRALFVGRLVREKGILDLLDAAALTPEVHVTVAGTQLPTERDGVGDEVRRRAASAQLAGRVDLLGMVDSLTLRDVVSRSDFLVLPSYREGVPRSLIEGMAAGRPAVVSDVRGCRELVQHGENGLVFPPHEVPALARSLSTMSTLSEGEYLTMSTAAFNLASTTYREGQVIERLVAAYSELGVPPARESNDVDGA